MGPVLYRLLKVARRMRKRASTGTSTGAGNAPDTSFQGPLGLGAIYRNLPPYAVGAKWLQGAGSTLDTTSQGPVTGFGDIHRNLSHAADAGRLQEEADKVVQQQEDKAWQSRVAPIIDSASRDPFHPWAEPPINDATILDTYQPPNSSSAPALEMPLILPTQPRTALVSDSVQGHSTPTVRVNPAALSFSGGSAQPPQAPALTSSSAGSSVQPPTTLPTTRRPGLPASYPATYHGAYQRQRDDLRHQVRMGDMSTWQAQKNMQHWREMNLPGQNGQKLGIPGGNAPTTQGFNYMLRQMAPTGTNAQNLREIRKAFNAATPQMRNTMFSNAMNLWQQGYTGKALNLNMMQAPVEQQAPPAG